jgi:hypothetical protein
MVVVSKKSGDSLKFKLPPKSQKSDFDGKTIEAQCSSLCFNELLLQQSDRELNPERLNGS